MADDGQNDDRNLTFKVERGPDGDNHVVDYLRLGGPADHAMFDLSETVEDHAVKVMAADHALDKGNKNLGGAGVFSYTMGSSTTYVEGDSFRRVSGDSYAISETSHDVIKDSGSGTVSRISGSRSLSMLDGSHMTSYGLNLGSDYRLFGKYQLSYHATACRPSPLSLQTSAWR